MNVQKKLMFGTTIFLLVYRILLKRIIETVVSHTVQVSVEATNGATRKNISTSSGYTVDLTPPEVIYVKDHPRGLHFQTNDHSIFAAWKFADEESQLASYQMRILQVVASNKIPLWPTDEKYRKYIPDPDNDFAMETTVDVELQNGHTYIVDVIAVNGAELGSSHASHGVTIDTTEPIVSQVIISYSFHLGFMPLYYPKLVTCIHTSQSIKCGHFV